MSAGAFSGIVLAGTHRWSGSKFETLGTRPLVPVALSPLISYSLRWLREGGISRATICANHASRAVEAALGRSAELEMELGYYQDDTPRGAAGCVRDAGFRTDCETFVIADGSAIPTVGLAELLEAHRDSGAPVTAVVHRNRSRSTPASPGGVYVFERRVLDLIPEHGFQDIKENLIPRLHRAGERVMAFESEGVCPRVLNAQTYLAVNQWVLERRVRDEGEGEGLIHPTAWVERGARLVGPVQLGPRVRVQSGATIVGPTSIGAESTVERNALVARSVVWSRCKVGEGSVVHSCVVGNDAVVPTSARLFNVVRPEERPKPTSIFAPFLGESREAYARGARYPSPAFRGGPPIGD